MHKIQVISPIDNSVYTERDFATAQHIEQALQNAQQAQPVWAECSIAQRAEYCQKFVTAFQANKNQIAEQITWQMGRPLTQAAGEVNGVVERASYMIDVAEYALADIVPEPKPKFTRFIRREPKGVVLVIAPWNYPYLTAINTIIPALMAGNAVILKHSSQTPLCAEQLMQAFAQTGLPEGVFQYLHLTHEDTIALTKHPLIQFVAFTGSVDGGHAVQRAVSERFMSVGLELGGKDPAYVRHDADLKYTVAELVSGVYYNSGQSCCGIERIYCHHSVYQDFIDAFVTETKKYHLGNPLDPQTTLGPMVRTRAAETVRAQIDAAIKAGARTLLDTATFKADKTGTPYLAPQVLINVDHTMALMHEENFGPVVGIMSVQNDVEAVALMNDSRYGLTASVWTQEEDAALKIGSQVQTGTYFMNRCDYLDPALAWTGVKDSGYGCSLSVLGYEQVTRLKSYHLKHE